MILSKLLKKYLKQKGPQNKVKEKVMQSLIQKGFEMETIHAVLNEMDLHKMKRF